jgi:hypothetical protein
MLVGAETGHRGGRGWSWVEHFPGCVDGEGTTLDAFARGNPPGLVEVWNFDAIDVLGCRSGHFEVDDVVGPLDVGVRDV